MKKILVLVFLFISTFSFAQINANDLPSLKEGEVAPDITGIDTTGEQVQLSKVKSPYTLLYIYDFNCRHCDSILPKLIKMYNTYKQKGLEVFAVPVESDMSLFKELIRKNNLSWINALLSETDLSKLREDYKLSSTPTLYLLDKNKKVLGKRLTLGEDVEDALKKHIH